MLGVVVVLEYKIIKLSEEGKIIAAKIDQDENGGNFLWANRVTKSGKHRISLKLIKR